MRQVVRETLAKRDLIHELVAKELKIRYGKPALGFLWSFFSPLFTVTVFYLVFSVFLRVRIEEAPFFLYLMSAVFTWKFFADSVSCSLTSLVDNRGLLRESGMPAYFIPLATVLAQLVMYLPSVAVLALISFLTLKGVPVLMVLLPCILLIHLFAALGISLACAMLYVRWRETRYVVDILLQALFYLTPAFYSIQLVKHVFPSGFFIAYLSNPFVVILNLYRVSVLRGFQLPAAMQMAVPELLIVSSLWALLFLSAGFLIFALGKARLHERLSY